MPDDFNQEDGPNPMPAPTIPPAPPPRSVITELPSRWPKTIGILSIIFGCVVFLWKLIQLAGLIFMQKFLEMAASRDPRIADELADIDWSIFLTPAVYALTAVGALWALVLFASGVMVIRRSRNARFASMLWAIMLLLLVAAGILVGLQLRQPWIDHLQPLADQGSRMAAQQLAQVKSPIALAVGLTIALPYPLFILYWFMRSKIKAECAEW